MVHFNHISNPKNNKNLMKYLIIVHFLNLYEKILIQVNNKIDLITTYLNYVMNDVVNVDKYEENNVTKIVSFLNYRNNWYVIYYIFFKFNVTNRTTVEYVTVFVNTVVPNLGENRINVTFTLNVDSDNVNILGNNVVMIVIVDLVQPLVNVGHVDIKTPIWYINHLYKITVVVDIVLLEQNLYYILNKAYDVIIQDHRFSNFNILLNLWFHIPVVIKTIVPIITNVSDLNVT